MTFIVKDMNGKELMRICSSEPKSSLMLQDLAMQYGAITVTEADDNDPLNILGGLFPAKRAI